MKGIFKLLSYSQIVTIACIFSNDQSLAQQNYPSTTTETIVTPDKKGANKISRNIVSTKISSGGITLQETATELKKSGHKIGHIKSIEILSGLPTSTMKNINSHLSHGEKSYLYIENADCGETGCATFDAKKNLEWVTPYHIAFSSSEETCELRCSTSWNIDVYDRSDGNLVRNTYSFKLALWALKYLNQESHYQSQGLFRWCYRDEGTENGCFYGAGVDPISLYPKNDGIEVYASIGIQDHMNYERLGFIPLRKIPSNIIADNEFWFSYARLLNIKTAAPAKSPIIIPVCSRHDNCLPEIKGRYTTYLKIQQSVVERDQSENTLNKLNEIEEGLSERINSCAKKDNDCLSKATDIALSSIKYLRSQIFEQQSHSTHR